MTRHCDARDNRNNRSARDLPLRSNELACRRPVAQKFPRIHAQNDTSTFRFHRDKNLVQSAAFLTGGMTDRQQCNERLDAYF